MNARALVAAFPLVLGMACMTSRSQSDRSQPTASAPSSDSSPQARGSAPRDPMVVPGPSIMGHGEDRIVDGRIASVSDDSIAIESKQGDTKTLKLVPETAIQVNGSDATHSELREGQPVRASFNDVDGQDVAVRVRAGSALTPSERSSSARGRSERKELPATAPEGGKLGEFVDIPWSQP